MLSKKLSKQIRKASEEMSMNDFLDFLQDLDRNNDIELNRDGWDYVIDFARYLVDKMKESLDKGEWFGYEIKALNALEDMTCSEDDIIKIDNYGFPCEIEDNDDLLYVLGIENQLAG